MKNLDFTPPPNQDFQPLPEYTQSSKSNETWVNITLTKTDSDGSRTQVSFIAKK